MDDPWGSPWADETSTPEPVASTKTASVPPITPAEREHFNGSSWSLDESLANWKVDVSNASSGAVKGEISGGWDEVEDSLSVPDLAGKSTQPGPFEDPQDTLGTSDDHLSTSQERFKGGRDSEAHGHADIEGSKQDTVESDDSSPRGTQIVRGQPHLGFDPVEAKRLSVPQAETTLLRNGTNEDDNTVEIITYEITKEVPPPSAETIIVASSDELTEELGSPTSRPSTPPSEHSHHDEVIVETPRTSFEDTPKKAPGQLADPEPSKALELAELPDGLTEDEDKNTLSSGKAEMSSLDGTESDIVEKDSDDFGDFEEGAPEDLHDSDFATLRESQSITPNGRNAISSDVDQFSERTQSVIESGQLPGDDNCNLDFTPDLSLVDKLFGDDSVPSSDSIKGTEDVDLADIQDFSTVEQRKIWYRISRYGTLRKFNTGNDENYVRINWGNSTVRAETLKIVARWMDAYGIHGGAISGGEKRLGSLFGWRNSDTEPSTLSAEAASEMLRSRSRNHQRQESLSSASARLPIPPLAAKDTKINTDDLRSSDQKLVLEPPSATSPAFGWSTTQPSPLSSKQPRLEESKAAPLPSIPTPGLPISSRLSLQPLQPLEAPRKHDILSSNAFSPSAKPERPKVSPIAGLASNLAVLAPLETNLVANNDDDDDEWGEMVSSPAVPTFQQTPLPRLGHKASKSLMSFPTMNFTSNPTPLRSMHGPSMSMSESISTPGLVDRIIGSPQIKGRSRNSTMTSTTARRSHRTSVSISDGLASPGLVDSIMGSPQISGRRMKSTTASPSAAMTDPWASTDLSYFDVPALQPQLGSPRLSVAQEELPLQHVESDVHRAPKKSPLQEVMWDRPPSPPPAQPMSAHVPKKSIGEKEGEQDRMVNEIIRALPDLSYMLR